MERLIYTLIFILPWHNALPCPGNCSCINSIYGLDIDCSNRGLIEIPKEIPFDVYSLSLENNMISTIPAGSAFIDLGKLKILSLQYNKIKTSGPGIWTFPLSVETIYLQYNEIATIEVDTFADLRNLRNLYLDHNNITMVKNGAFSTLKLINLQQAKDENMANIVDSMLSIAPQRMLKTTNQHRLFKAAIVSNNSYYCRKMETHICRLNRGTSMQYCGDQLNFTDIWRNDGINICFLDTVTSGVLFMFMLICGCLQCSMFRKYSTQVDTNTRKGTLGFTFQVLFSLILTTEPVINAVLHDTAIQPLKVYGYHILTMITLFFVWAGSLKLLFLERNKALPTIPTRGHGLVLLMLWTLALVKEHLPFISWWSKDYWWDLKNDSDKIEFGLWVIRYVCTISVFVIGLKAPGLPRSIHQLLVNDEDEGRTGQGQESTWSNVWKKLKIMVPYVWPKGSLWRQGLVVLCLVTLGVGRAVNVFIPIYSKYIVNSLTVVVQTTEDLTVKQTGPTFRWDYILIYCGLKFLSGSTSSGLLTNMRSFLWIPVQQFTTRRISVRLFNHLHNLSLRWHLTRKTGEVLRVMDRGTTSMNSLLSYVLFNILPTIIDITIAIVYFVTAFNYIFGLLVFLCMAMYLGITIWITEWRTKYRREMNLLDNQKNTKAVDSLLNFETVKYYGASMFETNRYDNAIENYQKAEWKSNATLNLLNMLQNTVITMSTVAGCLLCAWAVVHSLSDLKLTVGDYVLFGTYLSQLYGPLNWLGTYYRMIQQSFIDMENMFDLLDENQEIKDIKDADDLQLDKGEIEFRNVDFYYEPSKQILKNINFTVPPGQTYALVGHSGSGKSTIIRLLFRFYDVTGGQIVIDGQDICKVKQESLRQQIGVVPQDTVLFNDDIRYNIRYSKHKSTDDEVEAAADVADIHKRILTFPKKYETVVGERGLKLSGGEKQRVAIARTILKSPAIVLMDEATSALDTKTERNIQAALERVCENRTTIIVAHRLSTIIHAHRILVLQEGVIVEQGSHEELLSADGLYAEMWSEQQTKKDDIDNGSTNGSLMEDDTRNS